MLNITVFYHVNSLSAPFIDIRTAKKLPGTIFPDYLPLCIILQKFHCLFAQFWYTANNGLIWHLSTLFQMSHVHFHKFQVILIKIIPILSCHTVMQGMMNKNSSEDEIGNVNFLRRYGTYVLQNTKKWTYFV